MHFNSQNPMENELVVRKIASFLNCSKTLTSCRAVNKLWFAEFGKKALKKSVFVDLRRLMSHFPEGLGYNSITHSFGPRATIKEIINLRISNKIELLQDSWVIDFFEHKGSTLKYLALEDVEYVSFSSPIHFQFIEKVLFNWCPNLETLRLIGMYEDKFTAIPSNTQTKEIPLRNLIMDFSNYEYFSQSLQLNLLGKVFKSAKHLDSFVYTGFRYEMLLQYLPENLMSLASNHSRMLTSLQITDVTLKQRAFNIIRDAGWPLKKFRFAGNFGEDMRARDLNVLLEKYKGSLRLLHLEVSFTSWYVEREIEVIIHELNYLEDIELNVNQLNVGMSGLLGNLLNLRQMTLRSHGSRFGTQHNIQTMFRQGISSSLRFLSLDDWYEPYINQVQVACPNVTSLEVTCRARNFATVFSGLGTGGSFLLEDLTLNVRFSQQDVNLDNWNDDMVAGVSRHKLRAFTLVASKSNGESCPWMRKYWMEKWLSDGNTTYFKLEFRGFKVRADEFFHIARLLVKKVNFCKLELVLMDLTDNKSPITLSLPEVQLYKYIVEDVLQEVASRLRELKNEISI